MDDQWYEARAKMHAVATAFKALIDHADYKNALYSLDEGTAYVKRTYHTDDDIVRRNVND